MGHGIAGLASLYVSGKYTGTLQQRSDRDRAINHKDRLISHDRTIV